MRSGGKIRPGTKSKYLSQGLTLPVQMHTGAPVCLESVYTVSTADEPGISVALRQRGHLPGISNVCCACCGLCPDSERNSKAGRFFISLFYDVDHCLDFAPLEYSGEHIQYSWQLKPLCEAQLVSNSIEYLCYYSNKAEQVGQDLVAQAVLDKYKPKPYKHVVPSYRGHLTKFCDSDNLDQGGESTSWLY